MSSKADKNHLTLKQKAELCEMSMKPNFKEKICKDYGIHRTTLNRILQKKDTFLNCFDLKKNSSTAKQKSFSKGKNHELEHKLSEWIKLRQQKGYPVSGADIEAKWKLLV